MRSKQIQKGGNIMEYTQFGRTSLRVSKISYGTWQFGGDWGRVERSQWDAGKATVQTALELGINFFDRCVGIRPVDLVQINVVDAKIT